MAKVKTITNAQATAIAALWASDNEQTALDALNKLGFTREQLGEKLAHMSKVANRGSKTGKSMENAAIAEKIIGWLGERGTAATCVDIMNTFKLKSAAKVSIVLRDAIAEGRVIKGREDNGKVNYRVE